MTQTVQHDDIDVLLLAKAEAANYFTFAFSKGAESDRERVQVRLTAMSTAGMLTLAEPTSGRVYVNLSAAGTLLTATVTPAMLTKAPVAPDQAQHAADWLWLVLHGGTLTYGSINAWGGNGEIAHLLLCGVNLHASSAITTDILASLSASPSTAPTSIETSDVAAQVSGVFGKATCQCEYLVGIEVHARTVNWLTATR